MAELKLLVLDDDELTGQTLKNVAEFAGMSVVVTQHPKDFFAELEKWAPTHIALDLIMPDMDGVEVLAELSARNISANIMITSGVGHQVMQAAARSAAAHGLNIIGILPKPFNPRSFRELIDNTPHQQNELIDGIEKPHSPVVSATELHKAIEQDQLSVMFQPKVECQSGALVGFEVLARWYHPKLGNIPPDQFIAVAEQNQLIDALTKVIFHKALVWFSAFCQEQDTKASVNTGKRLICSINISALSLKNLQLFNMLDKLCQDYQIQAEQIMLELTETGAMDDPIASLDILTRLRMKGFNLSIDDFGTGFSSMLQLVRMPFTEVKVDKSFIMTSQNSRESRLVIKAIIDLAHSLGMTVIAEGIEDAATLQFLQQLGCDKAQGYFIGKPLHNHQIADWLMARNALLEFQRVQKLHSLKILDTPAEHRFDRITRLAKRLFNVPISLVSFIDENRQWFKSKVGVEICETAREDAFCNQTIKGDESLIILDASKDPLFKENPYVTGMPFVRFYAGYPIKAPGGEKLGSLCVIDDKPRFFSETDDQLLRELGLMVEEEIAANLLLSEDHLTGLLNRRGFEHRAQHLLDLCQMQGLSAALIYFDLDNFKAINDNEGHQAGDEALRQFGLLLQKNFRESDLLGRIGGDEFVALIVNQEESDSQQVMRRLEAAVAAYNGQVGETQHLHFSFGVAATHDNGDFGLQQLYTTADEAMYQYKRQATNGAGF
ncbi:MAG TPA: EAL domain-containing protein [Methylophaga sp.]|nr:EAL domain-containing protein [Methylophaga sp.]